MKCPLCGSEMLHGYLNVPTAIWSERKHVLSTVPDDSEKYAMHIGQAVVKALSHVESDCCPNCRHILIDVGNYENDFGSTH